MSSEVLNMQAIETEPMNDNYCYLTVHEYYIHESSFDNQPWTHDNIIDKQATAIKGTCNE